MAGRTTDVLLKNDDGSTVEFIGSLNNAAAPTQITGTYTVTAAFATATPATAQLTKQ